MPGWITRVARLATLKHMPIKTTWKSNITTKTACNWLMKTSPITVYPGAGFDNLITPLEFCSSQARLDA
jgi:hypothetical protein